MATRGPAGPNSFGKPAAVSGPPRLRAPCSFGLSLPVRPGDTWSFTTPRCQLPTPQAALHAAAVSVPPARQPITASELLKGVRVPLPPGSCHQQRGWLATACQALCPHLLCGRRDGSRAPGRRRRLPSLWAASPGGTLQKTGKVSRPQALSPDLGRGSAPGVTPADGSGADGPGFGSGWRGGVRPPGEDAQLTVCTLAGASRGVSRRLSKIQTVCPRRKCAPSAHVRDKGR